MKDNFTTSPAEAMTPREKLVGSTFLHFGVALKRAVMTGKPLVKRRSLAEFLFTLGISACMNACFALERAAKIMEDLAECEKQGATNH